MEVKLHFERLQLTSSSLVNICAPMGYLPDMQTFL